MARPQEPRKCTRCPKEFVPEAPKCGQKSRRKICPACQKRAQDAGRRRALERYESRHPGTIDQTNADTIDLMGLIVRSPVFDRDSARLATLNPEEWDPDGLLQRMIQTAKTRATVDSGDDPDSLV